MLTVQKISDKSDVLSDFCNICQVCELTTSDRNMPVVGECGHTFCQDCVENEEEMDCRYCSSKTYLKSVKHYCFKLKMGLFQRTLSSKEEVEEIKEQMTEQKKCLDAGLEEIEAFLEKPEYKKLTNSIIKLKVPEAVEEAHFIPENFLTPSTERDLFLIQIYKEVRYDGKLLTFHRLGKHGGGLKFGEISVWGNRLHFHSLQQEDPKECNKFIRFVDVKDCKFKCRIFLKISCDSGIEYIIWIKMISSVLSHQLLSLFTGECGTSYVGAAFERNQSGDFSVSLKKGVSASNSFKNLIATHYLCEPSVFEPSVFQPSVFPPIKMIHCVTIEPRGDLKIRNTTIINTRWVVGVVSSGTDLFALTSVKGKVVDCGISFTITQ